MHYTEGPDYLDMGGGVRHYKESPAPGTVVNRHHMNALQGEIAGVILRAGIALKTTGALDAADGWTQLADAVDSRADTRFGVQFATKTTTNLPEGTNLYWTNARFDARFATALAAANSGQLPEGANLYWTQARFDTAFAAKAATQSVGAELRSENGLLYPPGTAETLHYKTYGNAVILQIPDSGVTIPSSGHVNIRITGTAGVALPTALKRTSATFDPLSLVMIQVNGVNEIGSIRASSDTDFLALWRQSFTPNFPANAAVSIFSSQIIYFVG